MNGPRILSRISSLALVLLILLGDIVPATAAPTPRESLALAGKQYLDQEYEEVIQILEPIITSKGISVPLLIGIHELRGLSYLILGDQRRARLAFELVLELDPDHVIRDPSGSPKLRSFFESIKMSFVSTAKRAQLEITHRAPRQARAGESVALKGIFTKGRIEEVNTVALYWRQKGTFTYHRLPMTLDSNEVNCQFILPQAMSAYELEYYFEARGRESWLLKRVGSVENPLVLFVEGTANQVNPRTSSIWTKWWLWTGLALVAGGATTVVILTNHETAPEGNMKPGRIELINLPPSR